MATKKTEETNNMRLWDALGKTDPKHTKTFNRGRFSGTAIKPMWSFKRMTEMFGPVGCGWGMQKPEFQVVSGGTEIMVYCTVGLWYLDPLTKEKGGVFGVGGDKVVAEFKDKQRNPYLSTNDEAFKSAYTDALSNAMKLIGVGADVHMGLFDDNKYVREMEKEFSEDEKPEPEKPLAKKITKKERDDFIAAVKEHGRTGEVKDFLGQRGFASSGEITTEEYTNMMYWAETGRIPGAREKGAIGEPEVEY